MCRLFLFIVFLGINVDQEAFGANSSYLLQPSAPPLVGDFRYSQIVKTCEEMIVRLSDEDELKAIESEKGECIPQNSIPYSSWVLGTRADFLKNISQLRVYWQTRFKTDLKYRTDVDQSILESLQRYMDTYQSTEIRQTSDFFPRVDPNLIGLMFTLSHLVYYDKTDAKISDNTSSQNYKKLKAELEAKIKDLQTTIRRVDDFEAELDKDTKDTLKYLQHDRETTNKEKDKIREEGLSKRKQKHEVEDKRLQSPTHETAQAESGKSSSKIDQGSVEKEKEKTLGYKVKDYAPEVVKAKAKKFNALFRANHIALDADTITLVDIEDSLKQIKRTAKNQLIDAEESLRILSDTRVAEFWGKVDSTFNQQLDGFVPVDALYRNLSKYENVGILKGAAAKVAAAKKNDRTDLGGKELSGIMLYREGSGTDSGKVDELIFAFSGSNSEKDWKHNFDFEKTEGYASHNLATGFRTHQGFMNSLSETLDENGTKLKSWFERYAETHPISNLNEKPTLRIAVTGHSLGGALATLMGLYIKQNIVKQYESKLNIEVVVYTFGAPPIFHKDFAKKAENMLGRENVIRVWAVGDPVATMSFSREKTPEGRQSFLMTLLHYRHIGVSVPLSDQEGVYTFFDKFNPWMSHVSNSYANLLATNWKDLLNRRAREISRNKVLNDLLKGEKLINALETLNEFLRNKNIASVRLPSVVMDDVIKAMAEQSPAVTPLPRTERTVEKYQEVQDENYRMGQAKQPKLAKAEVDRLRYTHRTLGGDEIGMNLDRSTSCSVSDIVKKKKINCQAMDVADLNELSCGCCLAKNFFISDDSSLTAKVKSFTGKKHIQTIPDVYKHCSKHCAKTFDKGKVDVNGIKELMGRMGLTKEWNEKKFR